MRLLGAIFKRPTSTHCLVDAGEREGVYIGNTHSDIDTHWSFCKLLLDVQYAKTEEYRQKLEQSYTQ